MIVHGIGTILVSKREQNMLYTVGKIIPWGIRKPMITCAKVSFEGVAALICRVTVICIPTFHRNSYMCYIEMMPDYDLRVQRSHPLHIFIFL